MNSSTKDLFNEIYIYIEKSTEFHNKQSLLQDLSFLIFSVFEQDSNSTIDNMTVDKYIDKRLAEVTKEIINKKDIPKELINKLLAQSLI